MYKTYTTIQGDTWDTIAYKTFGTFDRMGELFAFNPDYIDVFIFPAGVVINLPEDLDKLECCDDLLPPWKKVQNG